MHVDWRLGATWTEAELWRALARAGRLERNFEAAAAEELTPGRGWNQLRSDAVIAHEPPGPVVADGPFARARHAIAWFEFSDPRIVRAHLDAATPLRGRVVLLELQAMGLRFLCPARVSEVVDESRAEQTTFGIALETLSGHIERGREWLVLTKDHQSGAVRFCIRAAWRSGDFPNAWTWLGFQLLARTYQRAWHHLAHARLRAVANGAGALPSSPVRFWAVRAQAAFAPSLEREEELRRTDRLLVGAALAALCGARSMAPLALLKLAERSRAAPLLVLPALGELVADKTPLVPNRSDLLPLAGRAAMGALVADAVARRRGSRRALVALLGAASAVGGAFATFHLRRWLGARLSNARAGVVEDVVVLAAGVLLARVATARRGAASAIGALPPGSEDPRRPWDALVEA